MCLTVAAVAVKVKHRLYRLYRNSRSLQHHKVLSRDNHAPAPAPLLLKVPAADSFETLLSYEVLGVPKTARAELLGIVRRLNKEEFAGVRMAGDDVKFLNALAAETGLPIGRNRSTTAAGRALLRGVRREARRKREAEIDSSKEG